ncbi:MAG: RnfH family protein [Candidatus Thiodiazotropha sp. (ex Dulcina madagascariensis)]|nr:RnfH family protein [Candidatus Thiodiazotropha sp. (ex Epidulcina cf. delphinae)]MCU7923673.1 RnfH family protein [Candidatus Thiodiazotropha sp. (ex Dulcina madagascariensis)]MCU7927304.1 RnfH family protein [Candidatus Thiodiazotropha sp. (ex Dulcina madagascariensis)]
MRFEVAYGKMDEQALLVVDSDTPLTARQAIETSGILQRFPEIDMDANKIGIFGKAAKLDVLLVEGDRVEIYRPLIADPKEARKRRAAEGKAMRKGGGEK